MKNSKQFNRRQFMKLSGTTLATMPFANIMANKVDQCNSKENPICVFSKHFQWLEYEDLGKLMKDVGFDGVNITVRNGGHVAPYDVERKLPEAIRKIEKYGVKVPIITTDIINAEDSLTEPVLKTASELGVKYYRMGHYRYDRAKPIVEQLEEIKEKLIKLAELNEKYEMKGNYQNVSGIEVGSSVWDIWYALKDVTSEWVGIQFDIRNAIAEGGKSWENDLMLVKDSIQSIIIRDFHWVPAANNTISAQDVPIGNGIVDFSKYFKIYKKLEVNGPMTVHLDYPLFDGPADQLLKKEENECYHQCLGNGTPESEELFVFGRDSVRTVHFILKKAF